MLVSGTELEPEPEPVGGGSSTAPLAAARASAVASPRMLRTTRRFKKKPFRIGSRMYESSLRA
jgi:hypothetical protein